MDARSGDVVRAEDFAVFAGVLPEGKYKLVQAFQQGGHTVGFGRVLNVVKRPVFTRLRLG